MPKIPAPLIAVIAEGLAWRHTHTDLEGRFLMVGVEDLPQPANKVRRCQEGMKLLNTTKKNPLGDAAKLIEELMELVPNTVSDPILEYRERISKQLTTLGLAYHVGGHIVASGTLITGKAFEEMVGIRDLVGVQHEFDRILKNLETDAPAAVTASCALLEALFKSYIADEALTLPADKSVLPLWKVIRNHLGLIPGDFEDENLKRVLSGLASTIDGIAALRTHSGSAHGRDARPRTSIRQKAYKVAPRHARLAAHSAMALAIFFIETLESR